MKASSDSDDTMHEISRWALVVINIVLLAMYGFLIFKLFSNNKEPANAEDDSSSSSVSMQVISLGIGILVTIMGLCGALLNNFSLVLSNAISHGLTVTFALMAQNYYVVLLPVICIILDIFFIMTMKNED